MPQQKKYPNTVNRRKATGSQNAANRIGTRTPLVPEITDTDTTSMTITFTQPVILKGTPQWVDTSTPTITVNSATRPTPLTVVLTWNAAPTASITVPFEDPSIRNMIGGYVQSGAYTFS